MTKSNLYELVGKQPIGTLLVLQSRATQPNNELLLVRATVATKKAHDIATHITDMQQALCNATPTQLTLQLC